MLLRYNQHLKQSSCLHTTHFCILQPTLEAKLISEHQEVVAAAATTKASAEVEEEEEESLFKADAVNEEGPERDRATQV